MRQTFEALGLSPDLVEALNTAGITHPFPIQSLTIADALAGRDVCGKAKTGSGKTLAFGLPLLERTPPAEPGRPDRTRARADPRTGRPGQRRARAARQGARRAASRVVYGGQSLERQARRLQDGVEIVVATPGRLIDLLDRKAVSLEALACVVLDEADRMADMGFLPQVEWVLRHVGGPHQTLLFSATLDGAVDVLVRRYQRDPVHPRGRVAHASRSRRWCTASCSSTRWTRSRSRLPSRAASSRTLMFTRTKRTADRLAANLQQGRRATPLPSTATSRSGCASERSTTSRTASYRCSSPPTSPHADCTSTTSTIVVHYDPPQDHKTYLHRSGRTARAGESGIVVTLVLWNEELEIKRLLPRIGVKQPLVRGLLERLPSRGPRGVGPSETAEPSRLTPIGPPAVVRSSVSRRCTGRRSRSRSSGPWRGIRRAPPVDRRALALRVWLPFASSAHAVGGRPRRTRCC